MIKKQTQTTNTQLNMYNRKRQSRQTTAPPLRYNSSYTRSAAAETLTDPVSANRKRCLPESTRRANPSSQTGFYCEPALDTGCLNQALIVDGSATRFCISHGKRQGRSADSCRQHSHNHCKFSMHVCWASLANHLMTYMQPRVAQAARSVNFLEP